MNSNSYKSYSFEEIKKLTGINNIVFSISLIKEACAAFNLNWWGGMNTFIDPQQLKNEETEIDFLIRKHSFPEHILLYKKLIKPHVKFAYYYIFLISDNGGGDETIKKIFKFNKLKAFL